MKTIRKYRFEILLLLLIVIIYLLLRLPNLTLQPIFADEAIYIRWAQLMRSEPSLRFVSLQDGKTPLFMWVMIPFLKVFDNPLLAGRLLSVLAGLGTLLGVFLLGAKFFNRRIAMWGALMLAVLPFFVFFDRMALVDTMLAAFTLWTIFVSLLLIKYPRFDLAMVLGYFLGGSILTKTPGIMNFGIILSAVCLFPFKQRGLVPRALKMVVLWGIALAIGFGMFNILRLSPEFVSLSNRDNDYLRPLEDLFKHPLDPLIPFGKDLLFGFFPYLLTIPVTSLVLVGLWYGVVKRNRIVLVLFLWIIVPLLFELTRLQTFTARYILFTIPPMVIIAAWGLDNLYQSYKTKLSRKMLISLLGVLLLLQPLYFASKLLTDPASAPLPKNEHRGYFEDWTAGYGFPEIADYLIAQASQSKVVVGTEGSFGTLPDGLVIYLDHYLKTAPAGHQVIVLPGGPSVSETVRNFANEAQSYFVTNRSRYPTPEPGLKLIKTFEKPNGPDNLHDAILLYQVLPQQSDVR